MDMIDALWYGKLAPYELGGSLDEKQRALTRLIVQHQEELAPLLSEKGAEVIEKLGENRSELNCYENRLAFREGFRLGAQLVAAALANQPDLYEDD